MKETSHGSSVITKFYVDRTQTKSVNHKFSWPTAFKLMGGPLKVNLVLHRN